MTCSQRDDGEVLIRIQTNTVPDYCQNIDFENEDPIESPVQWGIDLEVSWNKAVDMSMAKITADNVVDIPNTTDLLCSAGKFTETDYKLDSIIKSFGTTWSGQSDLAREMVGISLNGLLIA